MPTISDYTKNGANSEAPGEVTRSGGPVPSEAEGPVLTEGFQADRVLSVSFAHAMNDTYTSFLAPLLPELIGKLALSKTEAGLLAFLQSSPSLLQPVIGHLADRANLRYFVILSPAVAATMMSLLGVAPYYATLALLVMVAGLSSASLHAVAPAMAGRLSGPRLGRGMGWWVVGGYLGLAVGPILVVSAVNFLTLEGTPWLMIGGWLGSAILYLRLRDVPGPHPAEGRGDSWREGLQAMRPILPPILGILAARALLMAAMLTFLPTFLTERGINLWVAGLFLSIVHISSAAGAVLAGSMTDRLGRRTVAAISMFLSSLLMLVLVGVGGWIQLPVLIALGVVVPATQVVLMALVQESCPENRALANGIFLALLFISESVGAIALGAFGDLFGLGLAFAASGIVLLVGLPLVLLLPRTGSATPRERA
jgi:FSR family fosmidomycin resistance protein-like MFS transporter